MKPLMPYPVRTDHGALAVQARPARRWEWLWKKKHVCPWWLARTFDNRFRERFHPSGKILEPYLRPGMTALDLGCGMGFFSLAMARLEGPRGMVLSVDIQPEMLARTARKARQAGLDSRMETLRPDSDCLVLPLPVDFALAFWMAHEVNDLPLLLGRIHHYLNPGGTFMLVEPLLHVSKKRFALERALAMETGLRIEAEPRVGFSRTALFKKV